MGLYLARRLGQSVLILLGVTLVTHLLLFLLPADPVRQIAGRSTATGHALTSFDPDNPPEPALQGR